MLVVKICAVFCFCFVQHFFFFCTDLGEEEERVEGPGIAGKVQEKCGMREEKASQARKERGRSRKRKYSTSRRLWLLAEEEEEEEEEGEGRRRKRKESHPSIDLFKQTLLLHLPSFLYHVIRTTAKRSDHLCPKR